MAPIMPNFNFKPDQPELTTLLEQIHTGALQLPDFQRCWVWDDDRIRGLLASVSLGSPVGAILLLECGGEVRFQAREFCAPANRGAERRLALEILARLSELHSLDIVHRDLDQIRWPSWAKIARDCTARGKDDRPGLDEVETAVGGLGV